MTAEEFAKLTSQGVLKIQSTASSSNTPVVSAKPIVSTQSASQVKPVIAPVNAPPAIPVDVSVKVYIQVFIVKARLFLFYGLQTFLGCIQCRDSE